MDGAGCLVYALVLQPECDHCRSGRDPCEYRWELRVGDMQVCDGKAIRDLCVAAFSRTGYVKIKACSEKVDICSVCCVEDEFNTPLKMLPDGLLAIETASGEHVVIPAADIAARLDEWTPLWRMPRRPAIDAAEAPANEEV